jgi:hypothetical protein
VWLRSGLEAGDRVVTTDLGTPVPGMALRLPGVATPVDPAR